MTASDMILSIPWNYRYSKGAIKQMMEPVAKHHLDYCFICEGLRKTKITVRGDKICDDCENKLCRARRRTK